MSTMPIGEKKRSKSGYPMYTYVYIYIYTYIHFSLSFSHSLSLALGLPFAELVGGGEVFLEGGNVDDAYRETKRSERGHRVTRRRLPAQAPRYIQGISSSAPRVNPEMSTMPIGNKSEVNASR